MSRGVFSKQWYLVLNSLLHFPSARYCILLEEGGRALLRGGCQCPNLLLAEKRGCFGARVGGRGAQKQESVYLVKITCILIARTAPGPCYKQEQLADFFSFLSLYFFCK